MAETPFMVVVKAPVQIVQCGLYITSAVLGLVTAVLMGVTMTNFQYVCVLGAEVIWEPPTLYHGSESSCNFVIFVNVGALLIYGLLMGFFSAFIVCARVAKRDHVGFYRSMTFDTLTAGLNNVFTVFNGMVALMALGSAALVTSGLSRLCGSIMRKWSLDSCQEAEKLDWTGVQVVGGEANPQADSFYTYLLIIVIFSWISVLIWLFIFLSSCLSCCQLSCSETCWDPEKNMRYKREQRQNASGVYRSSNIQMRAQSAHSLHQTGQTRPQLQGVYAHAPPQGMYAQGRAAPPPAYTKQSLVVEKRPLDDGDGGHRRPPPR